VVAGSGERETTASVGLADRIAQALLQHGVQPHAVRDVVKEVTGLPRNRVYERVRLAQGEAPSHSGGQ
jgi:16S rRNA (cytidine1402-2'-O)-methyltransferase